MPDSSIPGSGGWAENKSGACSATGDGDVMLRFSPSLLCVERMSMGDTANQAAEYAIRRIQAYYPNFRGAIIAVRAKDELPGAACSGMPTGDFPYAVRTGTDAQANIQRVTCVTPDAPNNAKRVNSLGLTFLISIYLFIN